MHSLHKWIQISKIKSLLKFCSMNCLTCQFMNGYISCFSKGTFLNFWLKSLVHFRLYEEVLKFCIQRVTHKGWDFKYDQYSLNIDEINVKFILLLVYLIPIDLGKIESVTLLGTGNGKTERKKSVQSEISSVVGNSEFKIITFFHKFNCLIVLFWKLKKLY